MDYCPRDCSGSLESQAGSSNTPSVAATATPLPMVARLPLPGSFSLRRRTRRCCLMIPSLPLKWLGKCDAVTVTTHLPSGFALVSSYLIRY